ncbi:hypothetical protein CK203_014414 [Vitis vinifera]|uniref:Uncharacterized protein n=1 Tax=Vitis vinifera TaxID=29760 RepID=A0A438K5B2_VITVI|nr:hypothetical protein CK203_083987 [Vitis vinifera]RVX16230.1 hypothetical protein CK203_014422 [Vitis vinifera]RVX16397.1 hypothetical protein CK203_014414 [Vitis vinifera]
MESESIVSTFILFFFVSPKHVLTEKEYLLAGHLTFYRDIVRIGCKISGTVKGRLSLGTQTLQLGGIRRVSSRFLSWSRREAVEGFPIQYKAFNCLQQALSQS